MSLFAAVFVGGMAAWFINYVEDKHMEKELKQMYLDKYGSEWDDKPQRQGVVQTALGYGESPTLYYNEAEQEIVSGDKRGKVISMIGSDPRLRKLTKDKDITPEEAAKRLEISAEQFAVEFDDWAEQEMKTHGYNISFREWAEEESGSHGDIELLDWAQHEEESHDARYDAEEREPFDIYKKRFYTPEVKRRYQYAYKNYVDNRNSVISPKVFGPPMTFEQFADQRLKQDYRARSLKREVVKGRKHEEGWNAESYKPPASAVANAKRGLALRKEFGRGGLSPSEAKSHGIDSGVTRARKIASGKVSRHDVRRMSAFNRHRKNYRPEKKMPDGGPTAGTIAWLLWGGTSGVNWAKKKSAAMNAETMVKQVCLFCECDEEEELLVEVMLDGYPELICESCMDPNNWAAEDMNWGGDPDGQLAKALAKAREDAKKPRRPLKITKLPHPNQKSLKDFEEFNSAVVYKRPKGIVAQVMAREKALNDVALTEALLELEQYIRLGMISEEEAFRKIVQMSQ
tara:strand:+ start:345 stop:1886 length:1542 start_codon:yes stop_codon:yes gene_type:complete